MSNFIVGLTGGIGSGKSTVANLFSELGVPVIDADLLARELVGPGSAALAAIHARFGDTMLLADGSLDRAQMRQQIFADPLQRRWLEALLHPQIRSAILHACQQNTAAYVILMAPLLFENKLETLVNRVLTVDVSVETQIARTCQRDGNDRTLVEAIIAAQVPRDTRLALSHDVIDNEQRSLEQLRAHVSQLHINYLAFASQHLP